MKTVIFYRIIDHRNAGDMLCCPKPHFAQYQDCEEVDMRRWVPDPNRVSIFGGGGILYPELNDILASAGEARRNRQTGPVIIWGAGENLLNQKCLMEPSYIDDFDLVGLRDFGGKRNPNYVPCVSCLIPGIEAFRNLDPIFEMVIYDHFGAPIPCGNIAPRLTNLEGISVDSRMRFLALGKTILTNSYHGAYWAMLMGRKVILYAAPLTSRYFHLKYQPKTIFSAAEIDERSGIDAPAEYLNECRSLNQSFHAKVIALIQ